MSPHSITDWKSGLKQHVARLDRGLTRSAFWLFPRKQGPGKHARNADTPVHHRRTAITMTADPNAPVQKQRGKRKRRAYWQKRKDSIYLYAARQICANECGQPASVIDIGSNGTPTLEWHRATAKRLVSLDQRRPYVAEGVESITCDFLQYTPQVRFELVTCFQVLEHVPDPVTFARKLLEIGDNAVVSVPYKWKKGRSKNHLHDPVNERKMRKWFGCSPDLSYIATELNGVRRLIHVYR